MVSLIRYPIADALVRMLPARPADRLAFRLARAASALRLPAVQLHLLRHPGPGCASEPPPEGLATAAAGDFAALRDPAA